MNPHRDPSLRILHCIATTGVGGAEMLLLRLLEQWRDDRRLACEVLCLGGVGPLHARFAALGIPIATLGLSPGRPPTPWALWRFRRFVRACAPDVLTGWMYHGNLAAYWGWRCLGRRPGLLWTFHQTPRAWSDEKWLTRNILRYCARHSPEPDALIHVAETSRRRHAEWGYDDTRAVVIRNGVDANVFRPDDKARKSVREELGLPSDALLLGRVARFDPMKDYDTCLKAFARLRGTNPSVSLVVAGGGADFGSEPFRRLAAAHGFTGAPVYALGRRDDLPRLQAAFDVATSTSCMKETFPLVLGEAMACGVPCVSTDVGDAAELIGPAGRITPPSDAEALSVAWRGLLTLPPADRIRLGLAARDRVRARFTLSETARQYADHFLDAAGASKRDTPAPGNPISTIGIIRRRRDGF